MITIQPLKNKHIPELWEIIQSYPDYFNDSVKMETIADFKDWLKRDVIDCLVGIKDNEVIGCGYINSMHNNLAEINIFVKRKSIVLKGIIPVLGLCLHDLVTKHSLKMIYAVVRVDNRASIRLMKAVGFKIVDTLKNYEQVKGKDYDCLLGIIMAEGVAI